MPWPCHKRRRSAVKNASSSPTTCARNVPSAWMTPRKCGSHSGTRAFPTRRACTGRVGCSRPRGRRPRQCPGGGPARPGDTPPSLDTLADPPADRNLVGAGDDASVSERTGADLGAAVAQPEHGAIGEPRRNLVDLFERGLARVGADQERVVPLCRSDRARGTRAAPGRTEGQAVSLVQGGTWMASKRPLASSAALVGMFSAAPPA